MPFPSTVSGIIYFPNPDESDLNSNNDNNTDSIKYTCEHTDSS